MLKSLTHGYEQREEVRSHARHNLNMRVTSLQNKIALAIENGNYALAQSAQRELKELEAQL